MKKRKIEEIVILGGGTAGWITALYANTVMPNSKITLIESSSIGILGAGEGSTPHLIAFLDFVGIPLSDLVKHADATLKNGIKFTNWNKDQNDFYYHGFYCYHGLDFDGCSLNYHGATTIPAFMVNSILKDHINDFSFSAKISESMRVPFIKKDSPSLGGNGIEKFDDVGEFSAHFNASKLADYLKSVAVSRGVILIDGDMTSIVSDKENNITGLVVEGRTISADFVFDCSGFHRKIIGEFYGANWKSHADKLPVDSAIPFFVSISEDEEIPPYTEAIAMKHGWLWKIPTQTRFGCGYVFDSSTVSEEEALKEINEFLGYKINYTRTIKFSAGYYETPWIKNTVAVGLSSGFIEPLEATSIWSTISSLINVFSNPEVLFIQDEDNIKEYNQRFSDMSDSICDFIYFHYMTGRSDTDFWKKFTKNNSPERVKNMMNIWERRAPQPADCRGSDVWGVSSWLSVAAGIGRINKEVVGITYESSLAYRFVKDLYLENKHRQNEIVPKCHNHREFLKELCL